MATKSKGIDWLLANIGVVNLVDKFDEETLQKISRRVIAGYDIDITSRSDWEKKTEEGIKITKQIAEEKSFPWQGAANVKYPLIASASIQFAARSYPQIVNGTDIVKAQVIGEDPKGEKQARAKRVSQHMSYQCLDQMPEWEPDMDQLLHGLPVMGTYFKKTYFDPMLDRNRSICCTPLEIVVNMKHKGDLTTCRRISHKLFLYKNEVIERANNDIFIEDAANFMTDQNNEDESPQELYIEQHMWYDADGDGYDEPYIVTVHYASSEIMRIVANYDESTVLLTPKEKIKRITKIEYFTKFGFIPDPEGNFYDIGFAHLLGPLSEAMSTLINQMLDAGSLANTGGGFISKGLRWQGGRLNFELGEWKPVDTVGMSLKDAILPLPVRDPSAVLFQLLGLLNTEAQKLASVSDAMSGEMPSQNTPATTTLAMIEQGLKVFTAIYKRIFRSMKAEFKKMYRLNGLYLDDVEYYRVLDSQFAISKKDYATDDVDVIPVADPSMASEAQRLAVANALLQTMPMNPDPMAQLEILRQYYEAIGAKNIDQLINMERMQKQLDSPPPNPDMLRLELDMQKAKDENEARLDELEMKQRENLAKILEIEANTDLIRAKTLETIAKAEAVEPGIQLNQYKAYLEDLKREQQHERELLKMQHEADEAAEGDEEGDESGKGTAPNPPSGNVGMAGPPSDQGGLPMPPAGPPAAPGIPAGGTNLDDVLAGSNGDADYTGIGQNLRNELNSGIAPGE